MLIDSLIIRNVEKITTSILFLCNECLNNHFSIVHASIVTFQSNTMYTNTAQCNFCSWFYVDGARNWNWKYRIEYNRSCQYCDIESVKCDENRENPYFKRVRGENFVSNMTFYFDFFHKLVFVYIFLNKCYFKLYLRLSIISHKIWRNSTCNIVRYFN